MSRYYAFVSLDMVMPDQVDVLRRSQEGVVGWRYRPDKHTLDLLFETDVTTGQARLDALAAGQTVYLVLDAQKQVFHLPTKNSVRQLPRPEGRGLPLRKKSRGVRVADSSC